VVWDHEVAGSNPVTPIFLSEINPSPHPGEGLSCSHYGTFMAKVLIVDDSDDSCESLALYVRGRGHEVTCAPNGREALSIVLASPPDVILLDLIMPEMDGPSFLEVVRSYLRIQSLPVVVPTGLADSPMIERTRSLKVNSILVKGKATPDEVLKALEEALIRYPG
jgi:two-component system, sensor histidine kinase and response regulator